MFEWAETLGRIALPLALVGFFIWLSFRSSRSTAVADGPGDEPYRVYTRDYDLVLRADEVLARLPSASPDGGSGFLKGEPDWKQAIIAADSLLAERRRAFDADQALIQLRETAQGIEPHDIVVAILIDQSGSMKGAPIASVSATAAILSGVMAEFGAQLEILGFSTAGWRGGHPRLKWLDAGRPARPGRLCALMHIIYKPADEAELSDESRKIMVHPDLLRENVDGEAILWARDRLAKRPEPHKLLIVISDGAPVDDSTLQCNGPSYLFRHLMLVAREIEADPGFIIGGLGINHDVERCYWHAQTALTLHDIPDAIMRLLCHMIAAERSADHAER